MGIIREFLMYSSGQGKRILWIPAQKTTGMTAKGMDPRPKDRGDDGEGNGPPPKDRGDDGEGMDPRPKDRGDDERPGSPLSIILWTTPATELTMTMTKNVHFHHYSIIVLSKMDIGL